MSDIDMATLDHELRRDEGCVDHYYLDSKGIKTAMVGHNCIASPLPSGWKPPFTDAQINLTLNHDLQVVFAGLDLHIPWWRKLDGVRMRVFVNMAFNEGVEGLCKFHHMLADAAAADYDASAAEILNSEAARELPERYGRLAEMMRAGVAA